MWGAPFITFSLWPCEMKTWVALSWKPESEICCNEWFRINWAPFCTLYFKIKNESPKYCCDCQKQKFNWKLFGEILCLSQCVWKEWPSVLRKDNDRAEADKKVGPIYAAKNRFTVLRTDNHRQEAAKKPLWRWALFMLRGEWGIIAKWQRLCVFASIESFIYSLKLCCNVKAH